MKGVTVVLCGVECVNLLTNVIEILGIHFSYNKMLENEKNFLHHITKLQKVINIWKMQNLPLLGKCLINIHTATIELLSKIQKEFLWGKSKSNINMTPYVMIMKKED